VEYVTSGCVLESRRSDGITATYASVVVGYISPHASKVYRDGSLRIKNILTFKSAYNFYIDAIVGILYSMTAQTELRFYKSIAKSPFIYTCSKYKDLRCNILRP